jgi:hypothetical protein
MNDRLRYRLLQQRPDHVLRLNVSSEHGSVPSVKCSVFLPKRVEDQPYLLFLPTLDQAAGFHAFEFSVEGRIDNAGHLDLFKADRVWSNGLTTTHWGPDLADCYLIGEPVDLEIATLRSRNNQAPGQFHHGRFWLTRNRLLQPALMRETSYTGETVIKTAHQTRFALGSGLALAFSERFRYHNQEDGTLSYHELVAEFNEPLGVEAFPDTLRDLDDLLLLASFAERHGCVCLGWDLSDTTGDFYLTHYRRGITVPEAREVSVNDTLIDIRDFDEFLRASYDAFRAIEWKEPIRQALYGALAAQQTGLEPSILSMFAGLESLILFFRRTANLEFTLPATDWQTFESDLRTWLKKHHSLSEDPAKRRLMYDKLKELNRPSFAQTLERLIAACAVDVSDLWPVCEPGGLLDIRNRIIHGEVIVPKQHRPLAAAKQHLQWLLERFVLNLIKWPVERSRVCSRSLGARMFAYHEWQNDREILKTRCSRWEDPV